MQASIHNMGTSKIKDGKMFWHLYTDMANQFVDMIDVFPPARFVEKAERNMVAVVKVPELSPGESFTPTVVLRIDTTTRDWMMEPQDTPDQIKSRLRGTFGKMKKYWEVEDPVIQELSQSIAENVATDESYLKLAYEVVRDRLKLKTHLDERKGASRAVREKEGDCDEHADLLIALARAVKIPARRVLGHYYKGVPEPEPHAWCEVFLERLGWIPVDPALNRFGVLNENYFSRIREGLVSQRPPIQLKLNRNTSAAPTIEEDISMVRIPNGS